ncbi:hypothetical protein ACSBOB_20215 [Mesorhizobium sp. ASY16-5R]|uniref:hypothetical protein n=1 Tax=Mesorhizobium sp. ASY16-5R TaxID=3445772 RepID=UPI003FA17465
MKFFKGSVLILAGIFAAYGSAQVAAVVGFPAAAEFLEDQGGKLKAVYAEAKVAAEPYPTTAGI